MPYCTQANLVSRIGLPALVRLTDLADPPADVVDTVKLAEEIEATDSEIDSYIARRYGVAITPVPPVLIDIACNLTLHRLYRLNVPESVQKDADMARKFLRDLSSGAATLPIESVLAQTDAGAGEALFNDTSPAVFSRTQLADY